MRLTFMGLAALAVIGAAASGGTDMPADKRCCAVLELRQYTLKPGQRDLLIEIFDREFVETQEATGMRIVGQFRDAGAADRFVWIRGFADMEARRRALAAFYDGPVWKAHGRQAAATMIDSDNVLLLRPVEPAGSFDLTTATRAAVGATKTPDSIVTATIYRLKPEVARDFPAFFRETVRPALDECGIVPLAVLETESAANNYPRLPVREGEIAFVWIAAFGNEAAEAVALERLSRSQRWAGVESALGLRLNSPSERLRLEPTARSLLR